MQVALPVVRATFGAMHAETQSSAAREQSDHYKGSEAPPEFCSSGDKVNVARALESALRRARFENVKRVMTGAALPKPRESRRLSDGDDERGSGDDADGDKASSRASWTALRQRIPV